MVGIGAAEVFIVWLTILSSFWGLPLGIPPAPEDPLMAQVAPEQCLFYTTWSGLATADPKSSNQAERLMAEPELQRVLAALDAQLQVAGVRMAGELPDRATAVMRELVPQLVRLLVTQPGALYVSEVVLEATGPAVQGVALLRLGEAEAEVNRLLNQLPFEGTRRVLHQGTPFQVLESDKAGIPVSWGIWQGCLVVGLGEGTIEALVARADREPPSWWTTARRRLELPRVASLTYLNLERVRFLFGDAAGPEASQFLTALGLDSARTVISVSGLDETEFVDRTLLEIDGPVRGILEQIDSPPLDVNLLRAIPHNAQAATAMRLNLSRLWDSWLAATSQIDPQAAIDMREGLRAMEREWGIDIQDDLLPSLGDTWYLYTAPGNGGLLTGWTLAASLEKPDRVRRIHERLLGMLRADFGPMEMSLRSLKSSDQEIHYLVQQGGFGMPFAPAWCLTDSELVFGLFPQSVIAHLENVSREESLTGQAPWSDVWSDAERAPLAVTFVDLRPVMDLVYPVLQFTAQSGFFALRQTGLDLDVSLIPAAGAFTRHLGPAVGRTFRVADGVEMERRQPLPSGSLGGSLPTTLAMLLPAVQSGRSAARRTQGMNNLKQIGLGLHNFHDTYRGFPAAYSIDEDKKPQLSWRVFLLPFVDEAALYNEFRLDEPWDSEHNRALIARMPAVYRGPGSELEEGKTNYVAPRGERTILVAPNEDQAGRAVPLGTRMRDVLDGTSNTIAVVEANDESAVIWTKPDDWDYDEQDPIDGLLGLREGGFMALLTDGSVRFISALVDPRMLNALFTRDGGEPIGEF